MSLASATADLDALVRRRIDAWHHGERPDTAAVLSDHPELHGEKSLVLDLILEEYCLRTASGDTLVKSTFCERFPAYRQSIAKMLEVQEFLDQCPQPLEGVAEADWPQAGQLFMGYEVVEPLGRGALARVYLAREPALGRRPVVIKVSRHGAREAETLGKLEHPAIVPVYSVQHSESTGWTVICMPLVGTATAVDLLDAAFAQGNASIDGAVISRVARTARPTDLVSMHAPAAELHAWRGDYHDAIARFGWRLADGLHHAHQAGVMHRDIKPSNVLLGWSGGPMLLDFNLATDAASPEGRVGGTLAYMAPELIAAWMASDAATLRTFDPRADVYSLGAVLYELLTGKLPARPDDADALPIDAYGPWMDAKTVAPKALRSIQPAIDRRLESIVLRCLAPRPGDRYSSASELARELRAYCGRMQAAVRYARRRPARLLLGSAAALLLIGSAAAGIAARQPYHERILDEGIVLIQQGNAKEAEQRFQKVLALRPNDPQALFALGQALRQQRKWADARTAFLALEDEDPRWANALAGICAMEAARFGDAANDFHRAQHAGNRDRRVLLRHAYCSGIQRDFGSALHAYAVVLEDNPSDVDAYLGRALVKVNAATVTNVDVPDSALGDVRRACELAPDSLSAHYTAALVFGAAHRTRPVFLEEGAKYLQRAIELNLMASATQQPQFRPFLSHLAQVAPYVQSTSNGINPGRPLPAESLPQVADWTAFLGAVDRGAQAQGAE